MGSYTSAPVANLLRIIITLMNGFQIRNFVRGHFDMFNQKIIPKGLGPLAHPCIPLLQYSKLNIGSLNPTPLYPSIYSTASVLVSALMGRPYMVLK